MASRTKETAAEDDYISGTRESYVNHVDIFAADVAAPWLTQSWKRNISKMCFSREN